MSQGPYGVSARALTLAALALSAPLSLGGATAWAQATLCALVSLAAVQLACARRRGGGVRLASPAQLWLIGPLLSLTGALASLIPLRWLYPYLSPSGTLTLNTLTDPLNAASLNAPLWGALSLAPIETLSWSCLQAAFCLTAYLAYHLHPHRQRALAGIALAGPALTLYGLTHKALGLSAIYGLYESSDRAALSGFFTPIINTNSAASLMLLSALTALGLTHTQGRAWLICATLSLIGIWRCESRGALIVACAALLALTTLHPPKRAAPRALIAPLSLTALISAALWAHHTHTTQEATTSWLNPTPYPRLTVWRDALTLAQERWISGVGRGAFGEVFTRHQSFSHQSWISHIESHPLEQLIEGGVLGLIGGALLPALAWITWRLKARGESHATATALWIGVGAVGAHQCLDFGLNQAGLALPLALAWGILWSYLNPATYTTPPPQRERLPRAERDTRKRRATTALLLTALTLTLLTTLTLSTAHLQLRPTLTALSDIPTPSDRAERAREALGLHPTSAHITQHAALAYAAQLGLWSLPNTPREQIPDEQRERSPLWSWTRATKRRAPRFSTPHIIEARRDAQEGLSEIATLTYLQAINLAPWHLTQLIGEARAASGGPLNLTPLHPELIFPALEVIRRANAQEALASLTLLPSAQRLKSPQLRAQQLSLSRRRCDLISLSALRELTQQDLSPSEPCDLTFDRALARLLTARCAPSAPLPAQRTPPAQRTHPADEETLALLTSPHSDAPLLPEISAAVHRCAPGGPSHDASAWRRLQERLGRVLR